MNSDRLSTLFEVLNRQDGRGIEEVSEELINATQSTDIIQPILEILNSNNENLYIQCCIFLEKTIKNNINAINNQSKQEIVKSILEIFPKFDIQISNLLLMSLDALTMAENMDEMILQAAVQLYQASDYFHSILLSILPNSSISENMELMYNLINSSLSQENTEIYSYTLRLSFLIVSEARNDETKTDYYNGILRILTDFFLSHINDTEILNLFDKLEQTAHHRGFDFIYPSDVFDALLQQIQNPQNNLQLYHHLQIFSLILKSDNLPKISEENFPIIGNMIIECTPVLANPESPKIQDQYFEAAEFAFETVLSRFKFEDAKNYVFSDIQELLSGEVDETKCILVMMILTAGFDYNNFFFDGLYDDLFNFLNEFLSSDSILLINYVISFLWNLFGGKAKIDQNSYDFRFLMEKLFEVYEKTENNDSIFLLPLIVSSREMSDDLMSDFFEFILPLLDSQDISITIVGFNTIAAILKKLTFKLEENLIDDLFQIILKKIQHDNEINDISPSMLNFISTLLKMSPEKIMNFIDILSLFVNEMMKSDDEEYYYTACSFIRSVSESEYGNEFINSLFSEIFPIIFNSIDYDNISYSVFSGATSENKLAKVIVPSFKVLSVFLRNKEEIFQEKEILDRITKICVTELKACLYIDLTQVCLNLLVDISISTEDNQYSDIICEALVNIIDNINVLSDFIRYLNHFGDLFVQKSNEIISSIFSFVNKQRNEYTNEWNLDENLILYHIHLFKLILNEELAKDVWAIERENILKYSFDSNYLMFSSRLIKLLFPVIQEIDYENIVNCCMNDINASFEFIWFSLKNENIGNMFISSIFNKFEEYDDKYKDISMLLISLAYSKYNYGIGNEFISKFFENFNIINHIDKIRKVCSVLYYFIKNQEKIPLFHVNVCRFIANLVTLPENIISNMRFQREKMKELIGFIFIEFSNKSITKNDIFGEDSNRFRIFLYIVQKYFGNL
ncbi:hypothetical protein TVAG_069600 [Trichomonas vaginalis G3]|uniref:Importin N-terminal domain-containing protein n=1 Tax=Trichomonas vaginalis (strain ATCC PRA-98 / G3) TaxID=412133 RepID=A2ELB3_TRIV3|nr:armadillo (ARM) repeat-containing protein family [Trichomonas vaginalis G3]EAY06590.1 hypothetical protein TVAG_069600 [Trichomonas vaginalis G3]KAI5538777.1 armadillo (ARM) repeat-containing protein family [Trichomonas vaginalis G3]|eukprot:XP_001318813.1 hypothetical protein [Trichomonas vaginalis G3]